MNRSISVLVALAFSFILCAASPISERIVHQASLKEQDSLDVLSETDLQRDWSDANTLSNNLKLFVEHSLNISKFNDLDPSRC